MDLATRITQVLSPHLGENTADAVARHLLAKHGALEGPIEPDKVRARQATIRRGLVAFVGPQRAEELAAQCFPAPKA
jgi:hypothetical protein